MRKVLIYLLVFAGISFFLTCDSNLINDAVTAAVSPILLDFSTIKGSITANPVIPLYWETWDDGSVDKWYVSQENSLPAEESDWLDSEPASCTISGSYDDYTIYGWIMDEDGNTSSPLSFDISYVAPGTPDPAWDLSFDGGGMAAVMDMAIDADGNIYIAALAQNVAGSASGFDMWLKKFDSSGTEDTTGWDKIIDGGPFMWVQAIAVDASGNVYVGGSGQDLTGTGSGSDWFIKKYSAAGVEDTANWDKIIDNNNDSDQLDDIAIAPDGSVYAVGFGRNLDDTATPDSGMDWWIKKFSASGVEDTANWDKRIDGLTGNECQDKATSVCVNSDGYVYVAGYMENLPILGGSTGFDLLVKKFSPSGDEDISEWNIPQDGESATVNNCDKLNAIAVSGSTVFTVGFGYNLVSASSNVDWWIIGYTDGGWGLERQPLMTPDPVYSFTESEGNTAEQLCACDVVFDSSGNAYVIGTGENLVSATSSYDWHIKRFTPLGAEDTSWAISIDNNNSADWAYACTVDALGNVYVAGSAANKVNESSGADIWIQKLMNDVY
ncbi:MAG: hypothetical protein JW874_11360 [Spirochaetales bacterium]|nr:hypothetical protein [Spirochaetales bacterium]